MIPNGPGSTATFGGGTINTINSPTVRVTIDGAYTVGSLAFAPTNGTSYTLAGDNVPGHGLTFDSGNGGSANITVASATMPFQPIWYSPTRAVKRLALPKVAHSRSPA